MKKLADISAFERIQNQAGSGAVSDVSVFNGEYTNQVVSKVRDWEDDWGFDHWQGVARFIGIELSKSLAPIQTKAEKNRITPEYRTWIERECRDILNVFVDDDEFKFINWDKYSDALTTATGVALRCIQDPSACEDYSY